MVMCLLKNGNSLENSVAKNSFQANATGMNSGMSENSGTGEWTACRDGREVTTVEW